MTYFRVLVQKIPCNIYRYSCSCMQRKFIRTGGFGPRSFCIDQSIKLKDGTCSQTHTIHDRPRGVHESLKIQVDMASRKTSSSKKSDQNKFAQKQNLPRTFNLPSTRQKAGCVIPKNWYQTFSFWLQLSTAHQRGDDKKSKNRLAAYVLLEYRRGTVGKERSGSEDDIMGRIQHIF